MFHVRLLLILALSFFASAGCNAGISGPGAVHSGPGLEINGEIILVDDGGNYHIADHLTPLDGSECSSSIRELFPEEYHGSILSRNNVRALEPIVRQKAETYFGR